jgi:predicted amidohydrolase
MNVTLIQTDLFWENIDNNLKMFDEKITIIKDTNLIILPEMFTTGFSMNVNILSETMNGKTIKWMLDWARVKNAVIAGSIIIKENNLFYNRFIWAEPNGGIKYYDKKHLFSMANEDQSYSPGNQKIIIEYLGWKICPLICYDLRFPIWNRNLEDYDIAIYVANWPEKRANHWKSLLMARAIENQCYVLAVNRIGIDGKGLNYNGDTSIIDPTGDIIFQKSNEESTYQYLLKKEELQNIRKNLPFLKDRDQLVF